MKDKELEKKLLKETEESLKTMISEGITDSNLDYIYKLVDIHKDLKEEESMNYGNYSGYGNYGVNNYGNYGYGNYNGRGPSRGAYGESSYGENYGRRGIDSKYRGYGHLDRMYNEYGNYSYGRENYGANEDTKKSLKYMLESMEDFARMLKEEAQSQEEVQMIRETAQRIAQM